LSERTTETSAGDQLLGAPIFKKWYDAAFGQWTRQYYLRTLLSDDLEATLFKWSKSATGNGDSVCERNTALAWEGLASLHIKSRTSGATAADQVSAYRLFPMAGSKMLKFFVNAWRIESLTYVAYAYFTIDWYDALNHYTASVRYDVVNQKWSYLNSTNTWSDILNPHKLAASSWFTFELDLDFTVNKYLRMLVNDKPLQNINASFYSIADTSDLTQAKVTLQVTTQGANPAEAYYDKISLTEIAE
jgi:hypothetical protein